MYEGRVFHEVRFPPPLVVLNSRDIPEDIIFVNRGVPIFRTVTLQIPFSAPSKNQPMCVQVFLSTTQQNGSRPSSTSGRVDPNIVSLANAGKHAFRYNFYSSVWLCALVERKQYCIDVLCISDRHIRYNVPRSHWTFLLAKVPKDCFSKIRIKNAKILGLYNKKTGILVCSNLEVRRHSLSICELSF